MDLDACGVQRDSFDPDTHDLCTLQLLKHAIQDAGFGPAIHARVNRVPVAEAFGQSAPLTAMFGHIKDRIDHLQIAQADVATLPGQAVFNGGELFRRDLHVGDFLAQSSRLPLVLTRPRLELRQDTLDAIGHEIRSPLQTLLLKVDPNSELYAPISRMLNGVDKLYLAASVEEGIGDQEVICSNEDLAAFLSSYVANSSSQIPNMRYTGPSHGVRVSFDPIMFERVLSHLVDNALRYVFPDGELIISLSNLEHGVVAEVFNHGARIPDAVLALLFRVGSSDQSTARNRGIGLHASRAYLLKMEATIVAENRSDGVAMVIVFPPSEGAAVLDAPVKAD